MDYQSLAHLVRAVLELATERVGDVDISSLTFG